MNPSTTRRKDFTKPPSDPLRSVGKIASIASFGLFVIVLAKYVDGRYHCEVETAARETLAAQSADQQSRLERYQTDSIRMQEELNQIDLQSITFAELTQVQDQLLALARKYDCTLKKASPRIKGTSDFKTAKTNRDPQESNSDESAPEFEMNQAGLALNVAGDLNQILTFMKAIREQSWFASTDQLTLRREANAGGKMSLEMELNFISLQRKKSEFGEPVPPRT